MALRCILLFTALAIAMDASSALQDDAAVELDVNNFNQTISSASARFALLELYASWCPACRNYKPHYDQVAKLFNGPEAPHSGAVFVARIDCANEMNALLCSRFNPKRFPSLYWGAPGKFASASSTGKANDIEFIESTPRDAGSLLKWINKQIGEDYGLDDEAPSLESKEASSVLSLQDIEEATALSYHYILQGEMLSTESRVPFLDFVQLLAVYHPSRRCRKGCAEILVNVEDVFLPGTPNYKLLQRLPICTDRTYTGWKTCRGSVAGTRGYSCGLWLLFHSLSVRVDDNKSKAAIQVIRGFVAHFFRCEECRDHFLEMSTDAASVVNSRSDFALWLWRAHNKVNARVGKVEAQLKTGDPDFPKQQWPSKERCRSCSDKKTWNETAVYSFLTEHYGGGLSADVQLVDAVVVEKQQQQLMTRVSASVPEDITHSRLAVPVGAAFGIAMASCGFGLVAFCWRIHQKRRKLLRRRV